MKKYLVFIGVLALLSSCTEESAESKNGEVKNSEKTLVPEDTVGKVNINGVWVKPLESFMFSTVKVNSKDTLHLEGCSDFLITPFGELNSIGDLKNSRLKEFHWSEKSVKSVITDKYYKLQSKDSKLFVIFNTKNNPDYKKHYFLNGHIDDSVFVMTNNIRVGMKATDFYAKFLDNFPVDKIDDRRVILSSCSVGITLEFVFKAGYLKAMDIYCLDCYSILLSEY